MVTDAEAVWRELERTPARHGYVFRRIRSGQPSDVLLGLRLPERHPVLIVRVNESALGRLNVVESAGIEVEIDRGDVAGDREAALLVELRDAQFRDLFATLVADLVDRLPPAEDDAAIVGTISNRLRRWQDLLRRYQTGMALELQRGLFAELTVIEDLTRKGVAVAWLVAGWSGPMGAEQDFELPTVSLEVKARAATRKTVRIASEYQLADRDDDGEVVLIVVTLASGDDGRSLGQQVDAVRQLANEQAVRERLEDCLRAYGWLDEHAVRYESRLWQVADMSSFAVHSEFPRLVADELPIGMSQVSYSLDVDGLDAYGFAWDDFVSDLGGKAEQWRSE
jgi:ribosomal protein L30/L7E